MVLGRQDVVSRWSQSQFQVRDLGRAIKVGIPRSGIRITLPGRVVVGTEVSTTCNQVRCAGSRVIGGKFAGIRIVAEARVAINLRCSGLWHNGAIRPVLKHGPRSLTCVRVFG